ncbi:MAG: hypothetical protein JWO73_21 [Candidatus Taylorbacteria bacterium]|nr:hypothetical protein [Candidatus Taylorbacteria bacterium]
MKKQKRSRSKLIVSVALLSSLAMTNIAFASNDLSRTTAGTRSQMSQHEISTSTATSSKSFDRVKRDGKNLKIKKPGKSGKPGPVPWTFPGNASTTRPIAPRITREHAGMTATSTRDFVGKITAVNGSSFTLEKRGRMPHVPGIASSTASAMAPAAPTSLTVTTSDGTVYMKNGKLDSSAEIVVGAYVIVKGVLDEATKTIAAKGVHVIDMNAFSKKKPAAR